ncbi:hypothetical protein EB061_00570 [bacterium]|jgi:hypothetical protein|nr:hypothetical protein [bacterium]
MSAILSTSRTFATICNALILLALLPACGNRNKETRAEGYQDLRLAANLLQELADLEESPYFEPCDRIHSKAKREILSAIQRPVSNGSQPPTDTRGGHGPRRIPFQGSFLLDVPKKTPESKDWSSFIYGWGSLYGFYLKNKDAKNLRTWTKLNSMARSLLLEDKRRILGRRNYGIHRNNLDSVPKILSAVASCEKDLSCSRPVLDADTELSLRSIPYYKMFLDQLDSEIVPEARRALLPDILQRLMADLETFSFHANPAIRSSNENGVRRLTLEMDSGSLTGEEQVILSSIVEKTWTSTEAALSIVWKQSSGVKDLFEILFDRKRPGERPYVIRAEKTINLFPGTHTRSVAHEFGHVLGFPDHYFTTWDPIQCNYIEESDPTDLMSDSSSGEVTEEEWQDLLRPKAIVR